MTPYSFSPNQTTNLTTIYNDPQEKLTIIKGSMEHKDFFASVLQLRADAYKMPQEPDEMDSCSDLYILARNNEPIATMRVTQAKRGKIECEEFYPQEILSKHRNRVGTATRFAKNPVIQTEPHIMPLFIQEMWRDQVREEIAVSVINATAKLIPYYQALGYDILCGSFFKHPKFGTPSYVMLMLADPRVPSLSQDAFRDSRDFAFLDLIRSKVSICQGDDCFAQQNVEHRFVCPRPSPPNNPPSDHE